MKRVLLSLFLLLLPAFASAQVCSAKTSLTIDPFKPAFSVAAGWLQWLNHSGTFTCTGDAHGHVHCAKGSEYYDFYYYAQSSTAGVVTAYDNVGFRNTASFTIGSDGSVWAWTWDGGANTGWVTQTCQANPNNPSFCNWLYGTCD